LGDLTPPSDRITVVTDDVRVPDVVEIAFDAAVPWNPASAALKKSVVVSPAGAGDELFPKGSVLRIFRPHGFRFFQEPGKFVIVGGPDSAGPASPAITAADGTRLDGDYPQATPATASLPSGDGVEGGNFTFLLQISFK
jgi:hypothetical protein